MSHRLDYLDGEVKKFINKFNTPKRLKRWKEGVEVKLRKTYAGFTDFDTDGYKLAARVDPIHSYSYEFERNNKEHPEFHICMVSGKEKAVFEVLKFSLALYPHCCGMMQLNGFYSTMKYGDHDIITQAEMNELMAGLIGIYRTKGDYRVTRIIMNMVESRTLKNRRDELEEVLPIENPNMLYDGFWKWAHTQRRVRDMLMVNGNSGNVLHHMEVILK